MLGNLLTQSTLLHEKKHMMIDAVQSVYKCAITQLSSRIDAPTFYLIFIIMELFTLKKQQKNYRLVFRQMMR